MRAHSREDTDAADIGGTGIAVPGNAGHGVFVNSTQDYTVSVSACDIFSNGGSGIFNQGTGQGSVLADNDWWGDAAGPAGPSGDGITGEVSVTNARTSPFNYTFIQ